MHSAASDKLNLSRMSALVVDSDKQVLGLTSHMLKGFGMRRQTLLEDGESSIDFLKRSDVDLCIVEAVLTDMSGFDLVRWIRRSENAEVRFIPLVVLTGYTKLRSVADARDSGCSMVIKKPVSPQVLFDRLMWIAQSKRAFVETATYIGPDRRFRSVGPPNGKGRRSTDLSAEVGSATEPNLSQDEIDALMRPTKIAGL